MLCGSVGESATPTTTSDRACETCELGVTFSTTTDGSQCSPTAVCGPGLVEAVAPTTSTDRTCALCNFGTFKAGPTGACAAWTRCSEDSVETVAPSNTNDRVCVAVVRVVTTQQPASANPAGLAQLVRAQLQTAGIDMTGIARVEVDGRSARRATVSAITVIIFAGRNDVVLAVRKLADAGKLGERMEKAESNSGSGPCACVRVRACVCVCVCE